MSFRIEEKLFIRNNAVSDFKNFINTKIAKKIFEPRVVKSLYFENLTNIPLSPFFFKY